MVNFFRVLFFLSISHVIVAQTPDENFLNARAHNFSSKPLCLEEKWRWSDGKLIDPEDIDLHLLYPVEFGELWNDIRMSKIGQGTATYVLDVLLPFGSKTYDLKIPAMYTSYRLWVNEREVASNGNPGHTEGTTKTQWRPQTVSIESRDTLKLVLQIANFHHNLGGCREFLVLGEASTLASASSSQHTMKIIQCLFLVVMAAVFSRVYFLKGPKIITLYFALLCITWVVRSLFSNEYTFVHFFPEFSWNAAVRIEYITLYFTMIWAVLFLEEMFPREGRPVIKWFFVGFNCLFIVYTLMAPPIVFTQMLNVYLTSVGMLMIYALYVIMAAFINDRAGSLLLTGGMLLGIVVFGYDLLAYEGFLPYNSIAIGIGYILLFGFVGTVLLSHIGVVKINDAAPETLTWNDFYGEQKV